MSVERSYFFQGIWYPLYRDKKVNFHGLKAGKKFRLYLSNTRFDECYNVCFWLDPDIFAANKEIFTRIKGNRLDISFIVKETVNYLHVYIVEMRLRKTTVFRQIFPKIDS